MYILCEPKNVVFAHTVRTECSCFAYIPKLIFIYFSVAGAVTGTAGAASSFPILFFYFIYLLFPRHFIHEPIHNDGNVCVCVRWILSVSVSSPSCRAVGTPKSQVTPFDPFISPPNNNFFFASTFSFSLLRLLSCIAHAHALLLPFSRMEEE